MKKVKLTIDERMNFQYILPMQGSLVTLDMVEGILKKVEIKDANEKEKEIDFSADEMNFMKDMINFLDENNKLPYSSLSLVRKILNN